MPSFTLPATSRQEPRRFARRIVAGVQVWCNHSLMRARSAVIAGGLGVFAGACLALMQGRRVPPDLRHEMIASAESFVVAEIAAADLVSEALRIERREPARAIEILDRAEAAILALEPKIIRLGLVFGQDSSVKEKALECSMNLHMFLSWVRDRERAPSEAGQGFMRGADALHSLEAAASAEIRRSRPGLRIPRLRRSNRSS